VTVLYREVERGGTETCPLSEWGERRCRKEECRWKSLVSSSKKRRRGTDQEQSEDPWPGKEGKKNALATEI